MAAAAGGHGETLSSLLERRGRLAVALDANYRLQSSLNEALEELPRCLAELSRVEAVLDLADEMHDHDVAQRSLVRCNDIPAYTASLPLLPQDLPAIRRVHEELHDLREATCLPSWSKGDDAALIRCVEAECKRLAAYDASRRRLQDPLGFVASLDEHALARYALDEEDDGESGRRGPAFDWESIASRIAPRGSLPVHPSASCRTRWIMALQPARAKQRSAAEWTSQEEQRLREIVAAQGDRIDWHTVASQLDNGSQAHDCLVAYCRLLPDEEDRSTAATQTTQQPHQPTALDDEELLRHVSIFGFEWALIAERTRKRRTAVWDRFRRALKNTNVRGTWASDELERLATAIAEQQQHQRDQDEEDGDQDTSRINWTLVSLAVATRTPDQCRTRWSLLGAQPAGSRPKTKTKKKRAANTAAEAGGVRQKRQQKKRATPIPWRDDEDERLREAMKRSEQDEQQRQKQSHPTEEGGEWSWAKVADFVRSRAAWQARQRWQWLQKNEADWVAGGAKLRSGASAAKSKKKNRQQTEEEEDDEEMQGEEEEEEAEAEEDELLEGSNDDDADEDEQAQDAAEQQAVAASLLPPTTRRGRKRKTPQRDTDDYLTAQGVASSSAMLSLRRSTRRKTS